MNYIDCEILETYRAARVNWYMLAEVEESPEAWELRNERIEAFNRVSGHFGHGFDHDIVAWASYAYLFGEG